jgi:RNA polymerase sigma-70 factor, ECF subfamily
MTASCANVDASTIPREEPPERASGTLGELLYADQATPIVRERDWVELVQAMAGGDQRALRTLYEQAHRIVYTVIVRIVDSAATAEELTLDVFHDVWRRASAYDPGDGSVIGWMLNQARSRAIDRLRFDGRKKRVNGAGDTPPMAAAEADPVQAFDVREQARRVREALKVLTPAERQAVEMAFFGELTYDQAAARLNEPLGTVKTRIRSALRKLREALCETRMGP